MTLNALDTEKSDRRTSSCTFKHVEHDQYQRLTLILGEVNCEMNSINPNEAKSNTL